MTNAIQNPLYEGMYTLFAYKTTYHLSGDAFNESITADICQNVGLRKSQFLGDWWVHTKDNPRLTWKDLVDLSLHILHAEATRLFVSNLYLSEIPSYTCTDAPLPRLHGGVSGAKRVNAWQLYDVNVFRLHGKDTSCCVEGTWFDWCCFACNVLASKNTEAWCPTLYEPALENDNY